MNCPHCDSTDYGRLHSNRATPKVVDGVTFRAHRCLNCRAIFVSRQEVVSEEQAADILDQMAGIV